MNSLSDLLENGWKVSKDRVVIGYRVFKTGIVPAVFVAAVYHYKTEEWNVYIGGESYPDSGDMDEMIGEECVKMAKRGHLLTQLEATAFFPDIQQLNLPYKNQAK